MAQGIILPHFARQLKQYVKKHRSIKDDLVGLLESFDKREHSFLGHGLYKVRLKVQSLTRGKSASFRVIILLASHKSFLVPIDIYSKGERENMSQKDINKHLEIVLFELHMQNIYL